MSKAGARTLAAIAPLFLCLGCVASDAPSVQTVAVASPTAASAPLDIWSQLRQGTGYVVLLRHTQTEPGTGDPPGFQLRDCATQRNLSAEGEREAAQIGKAFQERKIPIAQVLSSQYCRCLDTARLLNLGTVQALPALNSIFEDRTTATEQRQQIRQRVLDHRTTRGVIVMVSHFANIGDISGISPQPGGAVVVRADQKGNLEVVERILSW
jgi:phosphohistidine phosphatase SixA